MGSSNLFWGQAGNGGAGGAGGAASSDLTTTTLAAPIVRVALTAVGGLGGVGGSGGPIAGYYSGDTALNTRPGTTIGANGAVSNVYVGTPSTAGSNGANGAGQIVVSGDSITASSRLALSLRVDQPGTSVQLPLNGAAGGNLVFSGNSFTGSGATTLDVSGSGSGAVVNDLTGRLSFDGSALNPMSGFGVFILNTADTFVAPVGGQLVVVYLAADPDTIVLTPGHAPIALVGATSANVILDFEGYGGALGSAAQLDGLTGSDGYGNTVISVPGDGALTLSQASITPTTADAVFAQGTPLCFGAGTMIATPDGEVAVEDLRPGALVRTAGGAREAVIWVGRRRVDCRRHPRPEQVWPVRVRAGTFGPGRPRRDVVLSPNHAVFVGSVLIPVKYLLNGVSIVQVRVDEVEYLHVALARHDLLLAEGLAAESYLDVGDRGEFFGDGAVVRLFPDFAADPPARVWEGLGCAPLVVRGPELEAARRLAMPSPGEVLSGRAARG